MAKVQSIDLPSALKDLFLDRLIKELARESGFIVRERKVKAVPFFWNLVLGFGKAATRTISNLRRSYESASGETLVPSAFYDRFDDELVSMLRAATGHALDSFQLAGAEAMEVAKAFKDVIVGDASDAATIYTNGSRSTYPELNAFVLRGSAGLRDLTEQLLLEAMDLPRRETGKKISKALCNTGQARKYVEFIQGERRYPGPTGSAPRYTLGYDEDSLQILAPGISVKLEVDFDITPRAIYFLAWDTFGRYESMAIDWIDEDTLLKMVPTAGGHKAGFLAYVGCVENQICTMPRASSRLEDLNDPICGD